MPHPMLLRNVTVERLAVHSQARRRLSWGTPGYCQAVSALGLRHCSPNLHVCLFLALPPVEVTLDPKTAHPELLLSDDRKSVSRGGKSLLLSLSDSHKRFNASPLVLGLQAFTAGRRYWEVQVGDKPEWGLGLCRESARRKGTVVLSPSNGFWVLRLHSQGKYEALTSPLTSLRLSVRPRRVGIFLDYEAGEITFYNVTDRDHIYTFTDQFAGPLRPLFCPGASMDSKNAEPLVISWVRETDGSGCILL